MCIFGNLSDPCFHSGCQLISTIRREFLKPLEPASFITFMPFEELPTQQLQEYQVKYDQPNSFLSQSQSIQDNYSIIQTQEKTFKKIIQPTSEKKAFSKSCLSKSKRITKTHKPRTLLATSTQKRRINRSSSTFQ